MDVELLVAGVTCAAMAVGHETIGVVWVLPSVTEERLPRTPFGPPSLTLAMVRVTWHIVTVFVLALGGLLVTLAVAPGVDPRTSLLRWFAAMWLVATAMSYAVAPGRMRHLVRLPVPVLWVLVAVLCWVAST